MVAAFLFILLVSVAGADEPGTVSVHEWGVILVDDEIPMALGAQQGYLAENGMLQPWYGMAVDAPVVWFHGPSFTGTFTVELPNGYFSVLIPSPYTTPACDESVPVPDFAAGNIAVWEGLQCVVEDVLPSDRRGVEHIQDVSGFQWAMPFWRRVPALSVHYEAASYIDRFVYYECSASSIFGETDPLDSYSGEVLRFSESEGELKAYLVAGSQGGVFCFERSLSEDQIQGILASWGNGEFLDQEIDALWRTWKPVLLNRCVNYGETVVVFPLEDEQVESISTLRLVTDQDYEVEYSRLFLAISGV